MFDFQLEDCKSTFEQSNYREHILLNPNTCLQFKTNHAQSKSELLRKKTET